MNEHESPEQLELRLVLEDLADVGMFEGFDDSILAEARGGSALRAVAKTIAVFQGAKVLRLANQIQQTKTDPAIKMLAQQLASVAAIALVAAFVTTGDRAIASRARSLGKGK